MLERQDCMSDLDAQTMVLEMTLMCLLALLLFWLYYQGWTPVAPDLLLIRVASSARDSATFPQKF